MVQMSKKHKLKNNLVNAVILHELLKIQNGSLTVVMQDQYPIQINTCSRYMKGDK